MNIVPVVFPCATGDKHSYMASIITPLIVVSKHGVTRMQAIINCLKEFNRQTYYDNTY